MTMNYLRVLLGTSALSIGLATLVAPAARAQVAVLSSNVEERQAAPGETYAGRIVIANASKQPQAVRIYQSDYRFFANGTSLYDDPGTTARSNARWITPQSQRVVVPPGGEVTVPYSVKVPAGDSLAGTYWSAILVEGATAPPLPVARGSQPQLGLSQVIRYSVQIATHIGSTGKRAVRFEKPAATTNRETGAGSLDLDVISTGDRAVRPKLSVELYDSQGVLHGKASQVRGLVYPGTSFRQHFDFGKLPRGTYKAVVFADTGDETVLAAQFTIQY